MTYKLAYIYYYTSNCPFFIIITFEDNQLVFKRMRTNSSPLIRKDKFFVYNPRRRHSLYYPIIIAEDSYGEVVQFEHLCFIPVRAKGEVTGNGIELSIPFWKFNSTNNPCNRKGFTTGKRISNDLSTINILIDGVGIIDSDDNTISNTKTASSGLDCFNRAVLSHFVYSNIADSIDHDDFIFGSFNQKYIDFSTKYRYNQFVENLQLYVNSVNIDNILSDLSVEIQERYWNRPGEDADYDIFRKATASDPIANNDYYLKSLLGIGCRNIYSERAFSTYEDMKVKDLVTGILEGEDLEQEKNTILSKYSKGKHLGYLIFEVLTNIINNIYDLPTWDHLSWKTHQFLFQHFHFDKIIAINQFFGESFINTYGEKLYDSNNDFTFQSIANDSTPTPQTAIKKLNDLLLNTTVFSYTEEARQELKECQNFEYKSYGRYSMNVFKW